jgi:hypothetical protein
MAYPNVEITNNTNFVCSGDVKYAGCKTDVYKNLQPGATWQGPGRGLCLLTKVNALVATPGTPTPATPYTSSGTSYSQFAIIRQGANYVVTRIVTAVDDPDTGEIDTSGPAVRDE